MICIKKKQNNFLFLHIPPSPHSHSYKTVTIAAFIAQVCVIVLDTSIILQVNNWVNHRVRCGPPCVCSATKLCYHTCQNVLLFTFG